MLPLGISVLRRRYEKVQVICAVQVHEALARLPLGNGNLAGCGLCFLREVEFQDTVFQGDFYVVGIDVIRQAEAAFVSELFVLAGAGGLDGQDVLFDLDVQIFFLDARNFDFKRESFFGLVVVGLRRVGAIALCVCGVQAVNEVLDTVESVRNNLCVHHNFNLFLLRARRLPLALLFLAVP